MKKLAKLIKSFFLAALIGAALIVFTIVVAAIAVALVNTSWTEDAGNVIGVIMAGLAFGWLWVSAYDHLTGEGDE